MPLRHLAPMLAALLALAVQAAPGNGDSGTQPEDRSHLPQLGDPYLPPAARKPAQRPPLAGAALQAQARAKLQQRFAAADTLKTGSISLAQAKAAGLGYVVQHFAEIDRQGSGRVSFEQVVSHQQGAR
ncbi:EF-hand domain-containing protein [Chitinimonas viridis]|uniref:EF-hand domain-containing protein n=1 Tax=Chitinimonas viridis TaxID=664880 RepID=A0ABT8B568_9NEIS|nr:EF-hand domain-containing protein [Chitinimonas viridis]MDN3577159.1 EF-hand domain-containing protein [Chitinimonas viridis]